MKFYSKSGEVVNGRRGEGGFGWWLQESSKSVPCSECQRLRLSQRPCKDILKEVNKLLQNLDRHQNHPFLEISAYRQELEATVSMLDTDLTQLLSEAKQLHQVALGLQNSFQMIELNLMQLSDEVCKLTVDLKHLKFLDELILLLEGHLELLPLQVWPFLIRNAKLAQDLNLII